MTTAVSTVPETSVLKHLDRLIKESDQINTGNRKMKRNKPNLLSQSQATAHHLGQATHLVPNFDPTRGIPPEAVISMGGFVFLDWAKNNLLPMNFLLTAPSSDSLHWLYSAFIWPIGHPIVLNANRRWAASTELESDRPYIPSLSLATCMLRDSLGVDPLPSRLQVESYPQRSYGKYSRTIFTLDAAEHRLLKPVLYSSRNIFSEAWELLVGWPVMPDNYPAIRTATASGRTSDEKERHVLPASLIATMNAGLATIPLRYKLWIQDLPYSCDELLTKAYESLCSERLRVQQIMCCTPYYERFMRSWDARLLTFCMRPVDWLNESHLPSFYPELIADFGSYSGMENVKDSRETVLLKSVFCPGADTNEIKLSFLRPEPITSPTA